jgi:hypothetical protein
MGTHRHPWRYAEVPNPSRVAIAPEETRGDLVDCHPFVSFSIRVVCQVCRNHSCSR